MYKWLVDHLANDFQYTKIKYKQYLYFSLFISPVLFCLLKLALSLNLIHFYLMYYQDNKTEHHKVIYPPYSRNCQVLQKRGNKQKYSYSLQLKGCAQYSLLVDITHYWLFKFLVEVKFLIGRQISRSLVNVNCKYASEETYPQIKTPIHKK